MKSAICEFDNFKQLSEELIKDLMGKFPDDRTLVIFDIDGVLLDAVEAHRSVLQIQQYAELLLDLFDRTLTTIELDIFCA